MLVKRVLLVGFLFCVFLNALGQKNIDIGFFGGTSYYLGDLNNSRQFYNIHPAYGGLVRFNYGPIWAVRASIFGGGLSGNDLNSNYKYQQFRKQSFYTPIVELTGQIELNFMVYRIGDQKHTYTPYVHVGGTFLIAPYAINPYQPAIPFGVGFKFNVSPRVGMGLEWTFRKTFTDGLDRDAGLKKLPAASNEKSYVMNKQTGYFHQRDWYSFAGLFVTYIIRTSGIQCNAYK